MPGTKSKAKGHTQTQSPSNMEVLTLPEAATYLRLDENTVLQMVQQEGLPGRQVGKEWRFFKAALQAWLSNVPKYKESLMELAGAWKDDPHLEEIVRQAYQRRARLTDDDEG